MIKKLNYKIGFLICALAIFVFYYSSLKTSAVPCETLAQRVFTQNLKLQSGKSPLDTAIVRLENRLYLIVTYMTGVNSSYNSTPVSIYPLSESGEILSSPMEFGQSEHIRSLTKLNTPWGEGILMADHGVDGNGFSGGNLLLLVLDKKTNQFVDMSKNLNQSRNFAFNAIGVRRSHKMFDDILIAPFNSPNAKVVYLKATDKGYINADELLPQSWRDFEKCFMTATPIDIDNDGKDEIALGGCDLNENQGPDSHDRLLKWKDSHWVFMPENIFPARKKSPTWGTVYWLNDHLNLMALTHNKGFTTGAVQAFTFDQNQNQFQETPVILDEKKRMNVSYYFHKMIKFKDVFLGLIRVKLSDYSEPNVFVLKKINGKFFEQAACLETAKNESILGIDSFISKDGKPVLTLTYYSGRFDVFY